MSYADIITLNVYDLLIILIAYMVGGVSTGYLLVYYMRGIDIRSTGSGGLGARNVGRTLGRTGFYLTLFGDILKGAVIVWLASWFEYQPIIIGGVVVAVIAGHVWPVLLRFRGGKGIATCLGAFAVFNYQVLLIGGGVFAITYLLSRRFLLSWVFVFLVLPLLILILDYPMYIVASLFMSSAIVIFAHKENIKQAFL